MPKKARAAQKIVRLIRGIEPQRFHRDFDPPRLHMVRIQIHHDGDHVAEILRLLCVADDLLVIDLVEL